MPHDIGHNHGGDHLHSHIHTDDKSEDVKALASEFVASFRKAEDKAAFLALAGVPLEMDSTTGGAPLKLVDARETTEWQIGAASPAFGTKELSYLPFPGDLIKERQRFELTYVSLEERRDIPIEEIVADRLER